MINAAFGDRAGRVMLLILTVIAVIAALSEAKAILAPFIFALVLGIVVSPLAERLVRLGVHRALAATAMLLLTSAVVIATFLVLQPLVLQVLDRLPRLQAAVESWVNSLSDLLRGIEDIGEQIEATVGAPSAGEAAAAMPSVSDAIWLAPSLVSQVFIFVGTFFFFLLTRNEIYRAAGPLTERLYRADSLVSRYFTAVTIVNIGVGGATGAAMMLLGVEHALLWGLAAGTLNYVLYLGPLIITTGLLVAGLIQFWGAMAFLPPLAFLIINIAEAQFVTPLFVGQHVKANPLVVFLAVVFGLWLWGPIGAIVALPVILWLDLVLRVPEATSERRVVEGVTAS